MKINNNSHPNYSLHGEPIIFDPNDPRDKRKVNAKDIKQALLSRPTQVSISHGIIYGTLDLRGEDVTENISLTHCEIDEIDFSGATFRKSINLNHSTIKGNAEVGFKNTEGDFYAIGANFLKLFNLEMACIRGVLRFEQVTFYGLARFNCVKVKGQACFDEATFLDKTSFGGMTIKHDISVKNATFDKEVSFAACHIDGQAIFNDSTFKGDAVWTEMVVNQIFQARDSEFQGKANFSYSKFGNQVDMNGRHFKGKANFKSIIVNGDVILKRTEFHDSVRFVRARVNGQCFFNEAKFKEAASFDGIIVEADLIFENAIFASKTDFIDANVGMLLFEIISCETAIFDFRGCLYNRLRFLPGYQFRHPFQFIPLDKQESFDRQPYLQLEKCLRRMGLDELADEVYYERRYQDLKLQNPLRWRTTLLWSWNVLTLVFTGYGVKPWRMLSWIFILLVLGSYFYSLPNAAIEVGESQKLVQLTWPDYVELSASNILPLAKPYIASGFQPSGEYVVGMLKFSHIAFIQVVMGWLLFLSFVAYLTGLNRRLGGENM